MDQYPHIFLNFYMPGGLHVYKPGRTGLRSAMIFNFFKNQDQITLSVIVHLQFVLPNYGTISPLTLGNVILYLS